MCRSKALLSKYLQKTPFLQFKELTKKNNGAIINKLFVHLQKKDKFQFICKEIIGNYEIKKCKWKNI